MTKVITWSIKDGYTKPSFVIFTIISARNWLSHYVIALKKNWRLRLMFARNVATDIDPLIKTAVMLMLVNQWWPILKMCGRFHAVRMCPISPVETGLILCPMSVAIWDFAIQIIKASIKMTISKISRPLPQLISGMANLNYEFIQTGKDLECKPIKVWCHVGNINTTKQSFWQLEMKDSN